jgi:hypothetical protein
VDEGIHTAHRSLQDQTMPSQALCMHQHFAKVGFHIFVVNASSACYVVNMQS